MEVKINISCTVEPSHKRNNCSVIIIVFSGYIDKQWVMDFVPNDNVNTVLEQFKENIIDQFELAELNFEKVEFIKTDYRVH